MRVRLKDLEQRIYEQANASENGWLDMQVSVEIHPSGKLKVPRGAFEGWSVADHGGQHLAYPWNKVSPVGLRSGGDDPYHSDWLIGSGLGPYAMTKGKYQYWEELEQAALRFKGKIQDALLNFKSTALLQGPAISGVTIIPKTPIEFSLKNLEYPPVLILKYAGAEWLESVLKVGKAGGAVIVESGGSMSHLVTEARASSKLAIMRKENARALYPHGTLVNVNSALGEISISPVRNRYISYSEIVQEVQIEEFEDKTIDLAVKKTTSKTDFVFKQLHKGEKIDAGDYMELAASIQGRDYTAHSSVYYRSRNAEDGTMVVYVNAKDRSEKKVLVSNTRVWKLEELLTATRLAFHKAVPQESSQSAQTKFWKDWGEANSHNFWLRNKYLLSTEEIEQELKLLVEDKILFAQSSYEDRYKNEKSDRYSSYMYNFKHYDIELERRGSNMRSHKIEYEVDNSIPTL